MGIDDDDFSTPEWVARERAWMRLHTPSLCDEDCWALEDRLRAEGWSGAALYERRSMVLRTRAANRLHYAGNRAGYYARNARRYAGKTKQTASWAWHDAIDAVYAHAQYMGSLGVNCHVDHIIPLKGEGVSGLHTHDNLQILIDTDNLEKSNRMPEDPYGIVPAYKLPAIAQKIASSTCK